VSAGPADILPVWPPGSAQASMDAALLRAEAERLRAERDEARHVAWLLWRDLRERELRGPSALRLARRYGWIDRSDGEALE